MKEKKLNMLNELAESFLAAQEARRKANSAYDDAVTKLVKAMRPKLSCTTDLYQIEYNNNKKRQLDRGKLERDYPHIFAVGSKYFHKIDCWILSVFDAKKEVE